MSDFLLFRRAVKEWADAEGISETEAYIRLIKIKHEKEKQIRRRWKFLAPIRLSVLRRWGR